MSDVPANADAVRAEDRPAVPTSFLVSSAPHLAAGRTTRQVMFEVVVAMLPLLVAATYFFHLRAITLTIVTLAGCLMAEAVANRIRGRSQDSLTDGSAIVTGMILAFSLPPTMPHYMAFIGGCVAIALAKAVFGGLGQNLFNPAMVGRAFLMICFPAAMANWLPPAPMMDEAKQELAESRGVAVDELTAEDVDAITTATPLYQASKVSEYVAEASNPEKADTPEKQETLLRKAAQTREEMPGLWRLAIGNVGGCVGETSALLALIGGLWLVFRGVADWRQPLGMLGMVIVFAAITHLISPDRFQGPFYHLTSGALIFGAFFIATDYVGAPITPVGRLVFGVGVGLLVMVIRVFGTYPEGVMFAILVMNAATPLIERWTPPTPFGGHPAAA